MGGDTTEVLRWVLGFVVMPLWLAAGAADAAIHRREGIERTAGMRESAMHVAMLVQLGSAVLAALLLEPTAALFALLLVLALMHEATLVADLRYAQSRRRIPVLEQWVHALQQALPWVALGALALLAPAQAFAPFGASGEAADWMLRWRDEPLPAGYVAGVLGAGLLLNALPFVMELRRSLRVAGAPRAAA